MHGSDQTGHVSFVLDFKYLHLGVDCGNCTANGTTLRFRYSFLNVDDDEGKVKQFLALSYFATRFQSVSTRCFVLQSVFKAFPRLVLLCDAFSK